METFSYQNPSSLDDCVSYYPSESFQEMSINDRIHGIRRLDSSVKVPLNENKDGSCLSSSNFEDVKEGKAKRRKKFNSNKNDVEEKKLKDGKKNQKKVPEKPPAGYVHVRTRRGQATDSHSLAERVRREKISERMKLLQDLVPGCEKVTGKALVLDEIINYVESLQNQVEFLSLKLASMNPLFYETGLNLDAFKAKSLCNLTSPWSSLQQATSFNNTGITTSSNYPNLGSSVSNFLQQNQNLNDFSQDKGNLSSDVINQREGFTDQSQYNTLCYFH